MKTAAVGGQDLRSFRGLATKFPTDDSKGGAYRQLAKSQKGAEIGPVPTATSLGPTRPVIDPTTKTGSLGGDDMSYDKLIQQDPLIQYMRKQAEAVAELFSPLANESFRRCRRALSEMFENRPTRLKWTEKDVEKLPDWE